MKKIVCITIFIPIILLGCSKSDKTRWVDANVGLRLRMEPTTESKQICLIPDGEKVELIKVDKNEVILNNKTGHWVQVKWNDMSGWAFDGFLNDKNISRWVTAKSGLPYDIENTRENGVIPYNEIVKYIGPGKWENSAIVSWRNKNVNVNGLFLSIEKNYSHDFLELRKIASEKFSKNNWIKIYPEDMVITNNKWLYHIIYISKNQDNEKSYMYSLWFNDGKTWQEIETDGSNSEDHLKMYNLDEDDNPDILISGGCCDSYHVQVLLGTSDKKMVKVFDASGTTYIADDNKSNINEDKAPSIISEGKCDKTVINFKNKNYTFDCKKRQFI